jgi:hypothetical protein
MNRLSSHLQTLLVFIGGIQGTIGGWFLGRCLVPDPLFGGILGIVTAPCGMVLGLIAGAVIARVACGEGH